MSSTLKRSVARGFTLIELLIVVIILAILAAIAIPQFAANTGDAQAAALDSNLAAMRTAVEQYRVQHTPNAFPGANASGGAACAVGAAVVGAAGSQAALEAQLTGYSNAAGQVCSAPNPGFNFGPYLRQGLPLEPITNSRAIVISTNGAPIAPGAAVGGWAYDTLSGQFVMNSNALGADGRALSAH